MPTPLSIERLQTLVPRVLERLNQVAPLPQHGTVAGQAVASVVWELLGLPIRGPIKDVDVFVSVGMPRALRGREPLPKDHPHGGLDRRVGTNSQFRDMEVVNDTYNHIKFIAARLSLKILHTYQAGLLNFTLISSPRIPHGAHDHDDQVSQELVNGFDLNAVGVGINLDTNTVVDSPGFLDFLRSFDLKAQTCNTPAHTLIRLARKYHERELTGVSCDYPRQRAMLELALACQRHYKQANADVYMGSVARFGIRYAQEHARLAQHLPACREYEDDSPGHAYRKQHGLEPDYQVFEFTPRTDWSPMERAILDWAGKDEGLSAVASQSVWVGDFPQIRSLLDPLDCRLPEDERQRRIQALEQLQLVRPGRDDAGALIRAQQAQMSDDERELVHIHALLQATGKPSPTPYMSAMTDENRTIFFLNQECSAYPDQVDRVVEAWEALSNLEQDLVVALGLRADWVLYWAPDMKKAWEEMLQDRGEDMINLLVSSRYTQEHAQSAREMIRSAVAWLESVEPGSTSTHLTLSPLRNHSPQHNELLPPLIGALEDKLKYPTATRIMRWDIPSWPHVRQLDPHTRNRAIVMWMQAGLELPTEVIDAIGPDDVINLMEVMRSCLYRDRDEQDYNRRFRRQALMTHALMLVPPSQWLKHKCQLVRGALYMEEHAALIQAMQTLGPSPTMERVIKHAIRALKVGARRREKAGALDGFPLDEDDWWATKSTLDRMLAPLERLAQDWRLEQALPQAMGMDTAGSGTGESKPAPRLRM